ncbi:MAG: hypothetical protein AAB316_24645 [Bacteroidota bacterium]
MAALPVATVIARAPLTMVAVPAKKPRRNRKEEAVEKAKHDAAKIRAVLKAVSGAPKKKSKPTRWQGFEITRARILAGFEAAKAIAHLPAEPLPVPAPREKVLEFTHVKAGRKKAGYPNRGQWLKAKMKAKRALTTRHDEVSLFSGWNLAH